MKRIWNMIYSTRLMAVLFVLFGAAMGVATFIENDYGTETSKALVYNTWWFELIMLLFVVNFFGNIIRYQLYKKEKWSVLLFHVSFLFIIIGAAVTRYVGYEGMMPIAEGETTNKFYSEATYLNINIDNNQLQKTPINAPILLSAKGTPSYQYETDFKGQEIVFDLVKYVPNVKIDFQKTTQGKRYLHFVESSSGGRTDHYIQQGELKNINNIWVGFESQQGNAIINFTEKKGELYLDSKIDGTFMRMADQFQGVVTKNVTEKLNLLSLHTVAGLNFVVPEPVIKGKQVTVSASDKKKFPEALLTFKVSSKGQSKLIDVKGGKLTTNTPVDFTLAGLNFKLAYGSKVMELPFSIKLNDFQLEKYPGSESAMSYASEITVIDPSAKTFNFRVFMNHVLQYKGYRFFQSSFDNSGPVEETRLSVNHDVLGTTITYIGYFALYAGLLLSLVVRNTRFSHLRNQLNKLKNKATLVVLFLIICQFSFSQHNHSHEKRISTAEIEKFIVKNAVNKEHALRFSKLVIQDAGGRMKPINTFASELLRKVSKNDTYLDLDANQVFVSMVENPRLWYEAPMIYVEKNDAKLREIIGIPADQKYACLSDFIDPMGNYKLISLVNDAEKNQVKSAFEKDVLSVDKRVGLLYTAISGSILRIYPLIKDPNNKWVSPLELSTANYRATDSVFVKQIIPAYQQILWEAKKTNNYQQADEIVEGLQKFQKKYGAKVYPSQDKIEFEILYNQYDIFKKLFSYYTYISVLLFVFIIIQIFKTNKIIDYLVKGSVGITIFLFVLHTIGLAVRWFISGHAPWSDAYESIIYVSWATMLFGLVFGRKSSLTIAATAFVAAMVLMIAHWNWLDPEVANLQPVLNSYWLMIHVAIIVASYGPFTLSMILGLLALFLMILTNQKNKSVLSLKIKEVTIINEMSMTVGLGMLTIGNFLGGMWANESWGRYWGWDPKETWALISIMVYAFVLHMRLVPGLRGRFTFNLVAVIAYASIMMTYFGVNFYLSGLHSYASGDQVVTPSFVYYTLLFVAVVGAIAFFKYRKHYKK